MHSPANGMETTPCSPHVLDRFLRRYEVLLT